ncbi:hypothetical protein [Actinocatenispora sera]|uniref:MerR-like DNA binding protein n=1 Tax=Actinocatenispora sera TaxID=390989 RepID=A0A810L4Z3_9ACTN|nr:hypothetical protein [Actinocatenispora sera]BCJ30630.1 hypothetical protein Asera_47380 [Actinocatenispora sera]
MDTPPRRADPLWTLDELVERAGRALSAATSTVNGRVRQLPDRRAVRWYASTGLVDRPGVMRGRVALYGPRQLLQLVAIKRRQAQGARLADIQAELAGADDAELAAIAAIPPDLLAGSADAPTRPEAPVRRRFWLDQPAAAAPAAPPPAALGESPAAPGASGDEIASGESPGPAAAGHGAVQAPAAVDDGAMRGIGYGAMRAPAAVGAVHGLALGDGAILLLPPGDAAPTEAQSAALRAAAAPLLAALASHRAESRAAAGPQDHTDRSDPQEEPR